MESRIARELKLRYQPIALIYTDEKPADAFEPQNKGWSCVISMVTAAIKGRTVALSRDSVGCPGGKTGLGFGNSYRGREEFMSHFLSTGKPGQIEGEGYKKSPELASRMFAAFPAVDVPFKYVVFKPLEAVDAEKESPALVVFYANADQISALTVLANYGRPNNDNVIIHMGSGCGTVCLFTYNEGKKEVPRAVVGLTDITARPHIDADLIAFSIPYKMFLEMEENVPGSFLERKDWKKLRERIK
jgi:uncharacterized protein (DUF169 family)